MSNGYTPTIIQHPRRVVTLAFEVRDCPCCSRPMVVAPASLLSCGSSWGSYHKEDSNTVPAQLERADMALVSETLDADGYLVCRRCLSRVTFRCRNCRQLKPCDQIQVSIGQPPEQLCTGCYEEVPAKRWDELIEKMRTDHMHDYE